MSNTVTRELLLSRQSRALPLSGLRDIALAVQRIKAAVALVLALVWLPAVSCCLIDASGLLGKRECCSKEHSKPPPSPGNCDQPCGALASASYLPQQSQLLVLPPIGVLLLDADFPLIDNHGRTGLAREMPATAPPELAGHWQFSCRTALLPRPPSFAS